MGLLDFVEGGTLGLVGDAEAGKIGERWHLLVVAFLEEVIGKLRVVGIDGSLDDRMVGVKRLDEYLGFVEVTASNPPNDLGEQFKSAFLICKIG